MEIEEVNLGAFADYREVDGRLQELKSLQDKKGSEVMRINTLTRYEKPTPEIRAELHRVVAERETIDQAISDAEGRLAIVRTVRSREICRGLREEYVGIVHRLGSAADEFSARLKEEQVFRGNLREKGIEVTWAPHPFAGLDIITIAERFREWILETLPDTSERKEGAQKRQRGGATASN